MSLRSRAQGILSRGYRNVLDRVRSQKRPGKSKGTALTEWDCYEPLEALEPRVLLSANSFTPDSRAVWMWFPETNAILDDIEDGGSNPELDSAMDFLEDKNVTTVYLFTGNENKFDYLALNQRRAEYQTLLTEMDAIGLDVFALIGGTGETAHMAANGIVEGAIAEIKSYNNANMANPERQFDGLNLDIEPWVDRPNDIGWGSGPSNMDVLEEVEDYLFLSNRIMSDLKNWNSEFQVGPAPPFWLDFLNGDPNQPFNVTFDGTTQLLHKHIQGIYDYITIQDYRDFAGTSHPDSDGIIDFALDELAYAASTSLKPVVIGVETTNNVPDPQTFFEEGEIELETQLSLVKDHFSSNNFFSGFAIQEFGNETTPGNFTGYRRFIPPQVTAVQVNGSGWHSSVDPLNVPSGADQTKPLPSSTIDQIHIHFSEDVNVALGDLQIDSVAVGGSTYSVTGFSYGFDANLNVYIGTWDFEDQVTASSPLNDRLQITLSHQTVTDTLGNHLDGEWVDGVTDFADGSGDGFAGGDFVFKFNVLAADANGNEIVDAADLNILSLNWGQNVTSARDGDFNGDGVVDAIDLNLLALFWQDTLLPESGSASASAGGGSFASLSLIEETSDELPWLLSGKEFEKLLDRLDRLSQRKNVNDAQWDDLLADITDALDDLRLVPVA